MPHRHRSPFPASQCTVRINGAPCCKLWWWWNPSPAAGAVTPWPRAVLCVSGVCHALAFLPPVWCLDLKCQAAPTSPSDQVTPHPMALVIRAIRNILSSVAFLSQVCLSLLFLVFVVCAFVNNLRDCSILHVFKFGHGMGYLFCLSFFSCFLIPSTAVLVIPWSLQHFHVLWCYIRTEFLISYGIVTLL